MHIPCSSQPTYLLHQPASSMSSSTSSSSSKPSLLKPTFILPSSTCYFHLLHNLQFFLQTFPAQTNLHQPASSMSYSTSSSSSKPSMLKPTFILPSSTCYFHLLHNLQFFLQTFPAQTNLHQPASSMSYSTSSSSSKPSMLKPTFTPPSSTCFFHVLFNLQFFL